MRAAASSSLPAKNTVGLQLSICGVARWRCHPLLRRSAAGYRCCQQFSIFIWVPAARRPAPFLRRSGRCASGGSRVRSPTLLVLLARRADAARAGGAGARAPPHLSVTATLVCAAPPQRRRSGSGGTRFAICSGGSAARHGASASQRPAQLPQCLAAQQLLCCCFQCLTPHRAQPAAPLAQPASPLEFSWCAPSSVSDFRPETVGQCPETSGAVP